MALSALICSLRQESIFGGIQDLIFFRQIFFQAYIFFLLRHHCSGQTKEVRNVLRTGLPDGLFSNQKSQIWVNFGGPLNGQCWYIFDHL
jgi:hypothetical protein